MSSWLRCPQYMNLLSLSWLVPKVQWRISQMYNTDQRKRVPHICVLASWTGWLSLRNVVTLAPVCCCLEGHSLCVVPSQVRHPSSVNQLKRQIYSAKEKKSIDSMSHWEDRQSFSKLLRILKFQQGVNMHLLSKGTKGVAPPTTDRPLFGLQSQTGLLNCQVCVKSLSSSHSGWRHLGRQTI